MTWNALFKVTDVNDGKIVAKASTLPGSADHEEVGTLTQNTERAKRMELHIELEDGAETSIKVGDNITGYGHFTS
jgi:hypothetical protein